jgi:hypothetical protein
MFWETTRAEEMVAYLLFDDQPASISDMTLKAPKAKMTSRPRSMRVGLR